jgi:glycosyltransferase involved in cell wall biosynthesis
MFSRIQKWLPKIRPAVVGPDRPTAGGALESGSGPADVMVPECLTLADGTQLPLWVLHEPNVEACASAGRQPSVLVLFPYPLLPADNGGSTRTLMLLQALRNKGYLVWLVGVGLRPKDQLALSGYADVVVPLPDFEGDPETRIRESGLNALKARYHTDFDEVVPQLVKAASPLAVLSCFSFSAYALARVPASTLRIVDTHDVQHLRADIALQNGGDLESRRCSVEDEVEALQYADILISIQPEEERVFAKMFPDKSHVVCGHAISTFPVRASGPKTRKVLFVGNRYDPNTRGMQAFIREVWPGVIRQAPDATLEVVGTVCRDLSEEPVGVRLHGFVPDVKPFYESAAVVVNPIAYGSGQKVKSIEALALGKCLVTTAAGRQGLPLGIPCVETGLDCMAEVLVDLLTHPEKRGILERSALAFAKIHFSEETVFRALFSLLENQDTGVWRR